MKEIGGIPVVISRGAPYEIGYNHGKSHPDRVRKSYEYNLKSCLERGDVTKEELVRIAMGFVKPVERYNPDYIEEVQGIADGAGMKFEELMVLNSRTELQKLGWNKLAGGEKNSYQKALGEMEACTSIAVTGERTVDGATYVGQNWDNFVWSEECLIYHIIEQKNGRPSIAYCGEAGIIARSGLNSCGIGDGVNSLSTNAPVNLEGVPLQFLLRGVMDSRDLGEAIDALNGGRNAAVNNILIAQKDNEAVDVEMDSGCCGILYGSDGILTHANHYVSPGHPRYPYLDVFKGNSVIRHHRSGKLLRGIYGKISLEDIQRVFSDHGNAPQSICRHRDLSLEWDKQTETVFSFVSNLTTLEMRLAPHNPCEGFLSIKPFDLL
ncbi:C45 family autoproteolytic acyltransferase/hydolase [Enterocloster lavalensis]|uniref:C45 family autoproteolytic acyltransferase/hydolase n=1 Tax=Enterocloster lavalensis TaxID=460384 RepID=UPI001D060A66|nr:C45 family peptidase [Enterocloster lavalensis]MBS5607664.1 hypothetical protein [Enterocloster asparagiformis]MCB6344528.1 C45 family peptidase [Enterocloster lavalensis]